MHAPHRPVSEPITLIPLSVALKLILILSLVAVPGCATRTVSTGLPPGGPVPSRGSTLVVVPFENLSHNRNAGLILTDLATTLVYAESRFRVIEVSQVADADAKLRRLEVSPWERQIGVNTASAVLVGRALEAEWVLVGSVGEYGFVDGFGETANVGLTLRLVRVEDSAVGWAGSLSRRSACGTFSEESVHRLGHEVLRELLEAMIRDLERQQPAEGDSAP
jgi:TolB-like protein